MKIKKNVNISKLAKKFYNEIEKQDDEVNLIDLMETFGKELSSATYSNIWFCDDKFLYSLKEDLEISSESGIINESRNQKLPMLFNRAIEHQSYNKEVDNPRGIELKDILYFPMINQEGKVVAIFKSIITEEYIHQFIHKDIEALEEFISFCLNVIEKQIDYQKFFNKTEEEYLNKEIIQENNQLNDTIENLLLNQNRLKAREFYFVELVYNLRLPLHSILGYSNFLKNQNQQKECNSDIIKSMINNSLYMQRVVDDILNFSKINNEIFEVKKSRFSLLNMYEMLVDMFVSEVNAKGIFFNTFYDSAIPSIFLNDKEKLEQILINLLENSIHRTPAFGKIEFNISYDKSKDLIHFSIIDSGIKILNEEKELLFVERYKAKHSIIKNSNTKVRLPFIKKVLTLLGAEIKVDSLLENTNFNFSLNSKDSDEASSLCSESCKEVKIGIYMPDVSSYLKDSKNLLIKYLNNFDIKNIVEFDDVNKIEDITHLFYTNKLIDEKNLKVLLQSEIKVITVAKKLSSIELIKNIDKLYMPFKATSIYNLLSDTKEKNIQKNILLIDDNIESLNILKNELEKFGAIIKIGNNGEDAINAFVDSVVNNTKIDMIFMNDNIQKSDAMEVTAQIMELSQRYNIDKISIIITTSCTSTEDIIKMKEVQGIDEVIKKPVTYDMIKEIFNKFK